MANFHRNTLAALAMSQAWLSLAGQSTPPDSLQKLLPADAKIIESADIHLGGGQTRTLVLWMTNPERVMAHWDWCGDDVYGDHWFGPTSLSLIDASNRKLINTIRVHSASDAENKGSFSVPFFTRESPYYVPHPDKDKRGKPLLLKLRDFTGEGVKGQFVLFDYAACGVDQTSVFGYSPKLDKVLQYSVEVTQGKFPPVVEQW